MDVGITTVVQILSDGVGYDTGGRCVVAGRCLASAPQRHESRLKG